MKRRRGAGCAVVAIVLAVLVGGLAWWFRSDLAGYFAGEREYTEASPEAAAQAQAKLDRLQGGNATVRLSAVELTSLLRYRAPGDVLEVVHEPTVSLRGDTVELSGRIPTDRLPSQPDLDRLRLLLPDTAPLTVVGHVQRLPSGHTAFDVRRVVFSGIPIPERYYSLVLRKLGRREEPELGADALVLPLPPQIRRVQVEDGYLVLTS